MKRKKKIKTTTKILAIIVVIIGIVCLCCLFFRQRKGEDILWITRNTYGEDAKEEILYGENGEEIHFTVESRQYTKEERQEAFSEAFQWARTHMLADNTSPNEIRSDLNFMTELPGGLLAEWISEEPDLIQTDGTLGNQDMREDEESKVRITLALTCEEETQMEDIYLVVKGPVRTEAEERIRKVQEFISKIEEGNREKSTFSLPAEMEGISFSREAPKNYMGFFLILVPIGFFFYLRPKRKEQEQSQKRQKAFLKEYPLVVNKLVLYLGAGLNLNMSFQTLLQDYKAEHALRAGEEKEYLKEELTVLINELQAGVGEIRAYESFGRRIKENCYQRLTALLVQNYQKGNEGLLQVLREEEEAAFRERIDRAKKEGEEAGTKLLFPMLLLLLVVMAIVMAPAVMQFQSY